MNRRSFFGFACGGIVAAPAAVLMGENVLDYAHGRRMAVIGEIGPELVNLPTCSQDMPKLTVTVDIDRDGALRAYVDKSVRQAAGEAIARSKRGGFESQRG